MSKALEEPLHTGREAALRHAWREAYDLLTAADAATGLGPEDLEHLAEAAWWTAHPQECIRARERAYALHVAAGNRRRAAFVALQLTDDYHSKLARSVAQGWFNRAVRLLDAEEEAVEHGYLAVTLAQGAYYSGDHEEAIGHARRAVEVGARFGDRDVQAGGVLMEGMSHVALGRIEQGQALMDEATVAAVAGELGPLATALVYCNTISTCRDLADYRRAGEWTEAAKRWCERQSITGFPGVCRVYRAEIMALRGGWAEAEEEARRACSELLQFNVLPVAGDAFYEVGEIRRRVGDLAAAEEAFRQAHELGRTPEPGLSLLRLAQGKVESAVSSIRRAVADGSWNRLARARLLPAQVEIALAAGDLEMARAAVAELEDLVAVYGSPALEAHATYARGSLLLAEGAPEEARRALVRAMRLWQEVEVPYEVARTRVLLARTCLEEGDEEAAQMELRAARSAFERLGAQLDARRVAEILGESPSAEAGPRVVRTLMFTDIVGSTNLVEAMGDEAWQSLIRWHDQTLRDLFARHAGEEVKQIGDGFLVAFEDAAAAVACAVAVQRTLAEHRRAHGFAPQVRIGLHTAEATRRGADLTGMGVHEAARIGALAEGSEVLASLATLDAAGGRPGASAPRAVALKGISEPVEVASVDWR